MANAIVDYFRSGKSLGGVKGRELVSESNDAAVKEAVGDPEIAEALLRVTDSTKDPYLRRKIFKALGT